MMYFINLFPSCKFHEITSGESSVEKLSGKRYIQTLEPGKWASQERILTPERRGSIEEAAVACKDV